MYHFFQILGALAFAELGTVIPRSGAEYAYFLDSFGPLHKFWGNLPAFIYSWVMIFIIRPAEVAVIILTFAEYFCQPLLDYLCIKDERIIKAVAILALGRSHWLFIQLLLIDIFNEKNSLHKYSSVLFRRNDRKSMFIRDIVHLYLQADTCHYGVFSYILWLYHFSEYKLFKYNKTLSERAFYSHSKEIS